MAWLVAALATSWSLLAALCLLWPGVGTADPDASLPAGFDGHRLQSEALVLMPIAAVILASAVYVLLTNRRRLRPPSATAPGSANPPLTQLIRESPLPPEGVLRESLDSSGGDRPA